MEQAIMEESKPPSDVFLFFPAPDFLQYVRREMSPLLSQVYSLAASATLSLIKLELERKHNLGPIYRGDVEALKLLQSFRAKMKTAQFLKLYAIWPKPVLTPPTESELLGW
jgi:hypothetical protein